MHFKKEKKSREIIRRLCTPCQQGLSCSSPLRRLHSLLQMNRAICLLPDELSRPHVGCNFTKYDQLIEDIYMCVSVCVLMLMANAKSFHAGCISTQMIVFSLPVSPLVVIPSDNLDHVVSHNHGQRGVDGGGNITASEIN